MARPIDVMHMGRDRVICAFLEDGLIVDPGPATGLDALLEGLDGEPPRGLLLTHIHLDHAGAAGVLARRFPDLVVHVHELGAPHLVDPSKLLRSAARLYGDDMERLWGEVAPVPEDRIRPLSGGERVDGFRVEYTPGHASHHVCYLHEASGDAYVGDVAGVLIPPGDMVVPPTPPPDIDLEAWSASLDVVAGWEPRSLGLTHFGRVEDVAGHIDRVREGLRRGAERAHGGDEQSFIEALERDVRAATDPQTAERFFQAAPPVQMWLGLERYWRKQAEVATP
jgi:glyoxylase-like metal-dependent hydrolase (beta-lactamase superfamily II)